MKMKTYKTVDAYIASYPKDAQVMLKQLRLAIQKAAPKAEEGIKYGMVGYTLGSPLVYFGGFQKHIGFYATPSGNIAFKKELLKYHTSKGAIQFPLDKPLPLALVAKMVKFRVKENSEKMKLKNNTSRKK